LTFLPPAKSSDAQVWRNVWNDTHGDADVLASGVDDVAPDVRG